MLRPGGTFANFGGQLRLADTAVEAAVHDARAPFLADDEVPPPDGTPADSPMQWPGTELSKCDLFVDVRQSAVERRVAMSRQDYVGHLSTISAYLQLPISVRTDVLDRVLDVLPERVTLVGDITLHLARKSTRPGER
jgi:hypothetical protein